MVIKSAVKPNSLQSWMIPWLRQLAWHHSWQLTYPLLQMLLIHRDITVQEPKHARIVFLDNLPGVLLDARLCNKGRHHLRRKCNTDL